MARTSITIVLELDESADVPVGRARLPDGTFRTFHGWLGLTEVIDSLGGIRVRSDATSPGAQSGPTRRHPTRRQRETRR
jgi:hypothetical protein